MGAARCAPTRLDGPYAIACRIGVNLTCRWNLGRFPLYTLCIMDSSRDGPALHGVRRITGGKWPAKDLWAILVALAIVGRS